MNKDEILEKSRRDNDGMDERFKLMQWRASYLMLSVMIDVYKRQAYDISLEA